MMSGWLDTPQRYGLVSRGFHWLMAALFAWQFTGAVLYETIGDTAVTRFIGGSHFSLGFVLFVLVLLRGAWGFANWGRRPAPPGHVGRLASAGHALLYALMMIVPGIALLRQYGSGKPYDVFGIPVMAERPEKIEWLMVPGNLFHYWLGFTLLAVLLGHVGMVVLHRVLWRENLLARMT